MAPQFNTYAQAHQSSNVQYATVLLSVGAAGSGYDCPGWASLGGIADTSYGIVFDDSSSLALQDMFGSTRPQMILIDPSGEFIDISPDTACGQCGSWSDSVYDTLLAPYFNGTVQNVTPAAGNNFLSTPASSSLASKHVFTSMVLLLTIVSCLYVQI